MSLKLIMTLIFTTFNQRAFMNRTVGEIMWGYEDPFIQLINKYFPDMFPFKGKFGLFAEVSMAQWEVGPASRPPWTHPGNQLPACFRSWPGVPGTVGINGIKPNSSWLE